MEIVKFKQKQTPSWRNNLYVTPADFGVPPYRAMLIQNLLRSPTGSLFINSKQSIRSHFRAFIARGRNVQMCCFQPILFLWKIQSHICKEFRE